MKYSRAYVEITNICNKNCSFCPKNKREKRRMTEDEFAIVANKLRPMTDYIYYHVMGEPLTHPLLPTFIKKANELGASRFAHEMSKTSVILKTRCVESNSERDDVEVVAYSYATANRVDFVSVLGGDGRIHPVPVHWVEYIPLENTKIMRMANDGTADIL